MQGIGGSMKNEKTRILLNSYCNVFCLLFRMKVRTKIANQTSLQPISNRSEM